MLEKLCNIKYIIFSIWVTDFNIIKFIYGFKIDVNSIIGTKLMARDGSLTVLISISKGSIRFTLQKGDISEIEKFICHLNDIKVTGKVINYIVSVFSRP